MNTTNRGRSLSGALRGLGIAIVLVGTNPRSAVAEEAGKDVESALEAARTARTRARAGEAAEAAAERARDDTLAERELVDKNVEKAEKRRLTLENRLREAEFDKERAELEITENRKKADKNRKVHRNEEAARKNDARVSELEAGLPALAERQRQLEALTVGREADEKVLEDLRGAVRSRLGERREEFDSSRDKARNARREASDAAGKARDAAALELEAAHRNQAEALRKKGIADHDALEAARLAREKNDIETSAARLADQSNALDGVSRQAEKVDRVRREFQAELDAYRKNRSRLNLPIPKILDLPEELQVVLETAIDLADAARNGAVASPPVDPTHSISQGKEVLDATINMLFPDVDPQELRKRFKNGVADRSGDSPLWRLGAKLHELDTELGTLENNLEQARQTGVDVRDLAMARAEIDRLQPQAASDLERANREYAVADEKSRESARGAADMDDAQERLDGAKKSLEESIALEKDAGIRERASDVLAATENRGDRSTLGRIPESEKGSETTHLVQSILADPKSSDVEKALARRYARLLDDLAGAESRRDKFVAEGNEEDAQVAEEKAQALRREMREIADVLGQRDGLVRDETDVAVDPGDAAAGERRRLLEEMAKEQDALLEHVNKDRHDQATESEGRIDGILERLQGNLDPADREILRKRQTELVAKMREIEDLLSKPRPTKGDYARARVLREQMRKLQLLAGS